MIATSATPHQLPCHRAHVRTLRVQAQTWNIERAQAEDRPSLAKILQDEKMNPLGINPERFTVARSADEGILGFGQVEIYDQDSYSEVRSMFVKEPYRGQGIGSIILEDLLSRADPDLPVYLTTIASSKGFFDHHGFTEISPSFNIPLYRP